jgi:hypothetical protein
VASKLKLYSAIAGLLLGTALALVLATCATLEGHPGIGVLATMGAYVSLHHPHNSWGKHLLTQWLGSFSFLCAYTEMVYFSNMPLLATSNIMLLGASVCLVGISAVGLHATFEGLRLLSYSLWPVVEHKDAY